MSDLPSISVVVPNFNGGATIAATLQSLVDQQYPKLELIVIDGGSSDDSVDAIRRFAPHIAYWISEKDRGQSDAINKGFAKATGEIVNWLCSDDLMLPGALAHIGEQFATRKIDVLVGWTRYMYLWRPEPEFIMRPTPELLELMPAINTIGQSAVWYRRSILDRPGPLREDLHFAMDMDLFCHFRRAGRRFGFTGQILTQANEDGRNKTSTGGLKIVAEMKRLYQEYNGNRLPEWWERLSLPLRRTMEKSPSVAARFLARWTRKAVTGVLAARYGILPVRTLENWYLFFEGGVQMDQKQGPA